MLLSGTPPFHGRDETQILQAVKTGKYVFHPELFDNLSSHCKDFISKLLVLEPSDRLSAKEAQDHPWLHLYDEEHIPLSHTVGKSLKNFHQYSAMKRMVCEVLSYTLMPSQIHDLRAEFEKIDVNKTGEFTLEEFRAALQESEHLSDSECDEIFNDMDVEHLGKIHWHEFIAATLNKCEVDDRNMKLAFEKLDHHHQGYLTVKDLRDILGKDRTEAEVTAMFDEVDSDHTGQITYAQFVKIMKGSSDKDKKTERVSFANVSDPDDERSDKGNMLDDNLMTVRTHTERLRLNNTKSSANPVRRNSAAAVPIMVAPAASSKPELETTAE